MRTHKHLLTASLATVALVAGTSTAAVAESPRDPVGDVVAAALEAVGQSATGVDNRTVTVQHSNTRASAAMTVAGNLSLAVSASDAGSSVVLERPDGFQILTALESGETATTFSFGGDVQELLPLPDGGVAVVGADGVVVGEIQEPWAVDAEGTPIDTEYVVQGTTIVQQVSGLTDAVYPIVVDPYVSSQFSWGLWTHVVSRDLTAKISSNPVQVVAILVAFIPTAGPALAAAIAIINLAADDAVSQGGCLLLRAAITPGNIYWAGTYKGSRCRAR